MVTKSDLLLLNEESESRLNSNYREGLENSWTHTGEKSQIFDSLVQNCTFEKEL
jgi:hypothetical protein